MSSIFAFALEYQQELSLMKSDLNTQVTYADTENPKYANSLLFLTQIFGNFPFNDILAVYPKDFWNNNSTPLLVVFTSLGLFFKSSEAKYGFFISYYTAEAGIITKLAKDRYVLPLKCSFSGGRRRIESSNPDLLYEIANIMKKCKSNVNYWIQHKRKDFPYGCLSYYIERLPWGNLEKQYAYNASLPSSTEKCICLPENQYEADQCVRYQNARFARGSQELTAVLDKLFLYE